MESTHEIYDGFSVGKDMRVWRWVKSNQIQGILNSRV